MLDQVVGRLSPEVLSEVNFLSSILNSLEDAKQKECLEALFLVISQGVHELVGAGASWEVLSGGFVRLLS